jgi:CheY-like chemotaxis protein
VTPVAASDPWRPWNPAPEPEPQAEVVATTERDDAPADGVPARPGADGGDGPNAGTVVIIEDDATAATYYATLFRGNGYHVEVANDGVSGVDLCTRLQPQLIMLDVMMPRQNGILVLQTLRASDETKNTPVVVMSNFSEPTLIKRAIQLGALEYVIKTQVEGPALLNALPRWMNHEKAFAAA